MSIAALPKADPRHAHALPDTSRHVGKDVNVRHGTILTLD